MLIGEDPLKRPRRSGKRMYVPGFGDERPAAGAMINAIGPRPQNNRPARPARQDPRPAGAPADRAARVRQRDPAVRLAAAARGRTSTPTARPPDRMGASRRSGAGSPRPSPRSRCPARNAHRGLREPWSRATELIAALRAAVGDDFTLMIDVQYAFPDADTCLNRAAGVAGVRALLRGRTPLARRRPGRLSAGRHRTADFPSAAGRVADHPGSSSPR